eukprot:TRINITY_DN4993_c0_g1_i2.p1 TRINITY_DN4993_c0_g1~~TRINITY_DN4993_c0_g1_i2.p1  ORF type:complete len:529 (+),score=128.13 TRINITY_DN4993_c0_g1_i2:1-1587(+)
MKVIYILFVLIGLLISSSISKQFYVSKSGDGKYFLGEGRNANALAYGDYEHDMKTKGWNKLVVNTNVNVVASDLELAYAAGYLEGAVDLDIYASYLSNVQQYANNTLPAGEINWLNENWEWTKDMAHSKPSDPVFWTQVELLVSQLEGMVQGYNDYTTDRPLTLMDFLIVNAQGDRCILDMIYLNGKLPSFLLEKLYKQHFTAYHCSALIRINDDWSDIFTGHTTWSGFSTMVRTYKIYNLQFNNAISSTISFSSYPACLSSTDDFYVTDKGLSIIETTNGIMNTSLLQYVKPQSLLSWVRVIIANQVASSGFWWVNNFSKFNSGTYNNQWIITDLKLFEPKNRQLKAGTLYIAEQIPGYIESADMTNFLQENQHWPSYNIPYFPYIYNTSGFLQYYEKYGDSYSYSKCPRARIFARDQSKVNSLDAFKFIMRYNDFKNDPLSLGDAGNAISSRYDLNPSNSSDYSAFGGLDSKVTSFTRYPDGMKVSAQSGPTYNQQPAFNWNNWPNCSHLGQPELFNFGFHDYKTN